MSDPSGVGQERQRGTWPNAVLYCIRDPLDHGVVLQPLESYPAHHPNIFGPARFEPRCIACGALRYIAAVEVIRV